MKQMKYKKQIQLIAAIVTLIVFPVIAFYLMEAYTHNPFEEVRPWAQFFNILLFELLAWIFVSVTGKIRCGLRIELVTAMIYGIANAYVVRFRTNPIVHGIFFPGRRRQVWRPIMILNRTREWLW